MLFASQRDRCRQALLIETPTGRLALAPQARSRIVGLLAITGCMIAGVTIFGVRNFSFLVNDVQAAVGFEVRLAEDASGPNLQEVKILNTERSVYLHREVIISNGDIATAQVIDGSRAAQYSVAVEFTNAGAAKIQRATANHIGRPVAILIDGQVVMAPIVRSPLGTSAVIT